MDLKFIIEHVEQLQCEKESRDENIQMIFIFLTQRNQVKIREVIIRVIRDKLQKSGTQTFVLSSPTSFSLYF